ncbi:MAG: MFS transporter [Angustibacter sp.]
MTGDLPMIGPSALVPVRTSQARGRWVLVATVLGSSIASLDATVVNLALPAIGRDLDADLVGLQWTINGYLLTLAALILLGGALGDRLGRRRVFLWGAGGFAVSSLLCAVAPSVELLIAGRVLQGVASALLTPGSLAIISASFDPRDRSAAIGAWSGLSGVAGAVGPFLGGWLIEQASWRWIFLINLPVAVVVIVVALRHVPESRDEQADPHVDMVGAGTGVLWLAALTWGLISWGAGGLDALAVGCLVVAGLGLAGFATIERRSPHPLVPPDIFRSARFTASNVVTCVVYAALSGVFFVLALQLQLVSGFSPTAAGAALLPVTALMLLGSARVGRWSERFGPRPFMTVGPITSGLGLLLLARVGADASYLGDVLPAVAVFGLGLTLTVAPLTSAVLGSAPDRHAGIASGINNAVARAAGLIAIAVLPLATGLGSGSLDNPAAYDAGFGRAMVGCAVLLGLGGVLSALLVGGRASSPPPAPNTEQPQPGPCHHCAIDAPPLAGHRTAT